MSNRREVLNTFPYKGKSYTKGGYIVESKFSEIELSILERMGNIAPKPKEDKTLKPKKRQEKKNVDKDKG